VRALPTSHADRAAAARRRARRPPGRGGKRFEDMGRRASVESYEVAAESGEHSVRSARSGSPLPTIARTAASSVLVLPVVRRVGAGPAGIRLAAQEGNGPPAA